MLTEGYFKSKNYEIATEIDISHLLDLRLKSGRNSTTEKYNIQIMFSAITEQPGGWRNSKVSVTEQPLHDHYQFHNCQSLLSLLSERDKDHGLPILILSRPNIIFIADIFLAVLGYIIKEFRHPKKTPNIWKMTLVSHQHRSQKRPIKFKSGKLQKLWSPDGLFFTKFSIILLIFQRRAPNKIGLSQNRTLE